MMASAQFNGDSGLRLPLHRAPVPLAPARHRDLALKRTDEPYGFARETALVPITVDEFELAMLAYPIVLVGPARRPAVVVGLEPDRNLFVSEEGRYAPGLYVPAYLRCHPFALARDVTGNYVLHIDEASDRLVPRGTPQSDPLFEADQPSAVTQAAAALCMGFAEAEQRSAAFVQLAEAHGLLEPCQAHFRRKLDDGSQGDPELLLDYLSVTRVRIDALDARALAAIRDGGALAPAYAQLFSAANWNVLTLWAA